MRDKLPGTIVLLLGIMAPLVCAAGERDRPNVLMIAIDDLKPLLACYGAEGVVTPNIDRLAARGTRFLNAHCQQAVCAPSRASLLTGLRPDTTKVWDLKTRFRDHIPEVVTLPQHFKAYGYHTAGTGKVFDPRSTDGHQTMDAVSWSQPYIHPSSPSDDTFHYRNQEIVERINAGKLDAEAKGIKGWANVRSHIGLRPTTDRADVPDEAYPDGAIAATGVRLIGELAGSDSPFFIAVGFKKPHLPFNAPARYWDLYDRNEINLETYRDIPLGAPEHAFQPSWELRSYSDVPKEGPIPEDDQRRLIHGYLACVSYVDAQIGKLLNALDEHGVNGDTIVVLWGDHGFHLGDHGMFCKHTNYEQATRSPLIIAAPDRGKKGASSSAPVELVDIYPTVCALADLPIGDHLHGMSLVPIMDDPSVSVKDVAVSQYPRRYDDKSGVMGYALRDTRHRYVEWRRSIVDDTPGTGEIVARELYDYESDPLETRNLVDDPQYEQVRERLEVLARELTRPDTSEAPVVAGGEHAPDPPVTIAAPASTHLPPIHWRKPDALVPYCTTATGDLRLHVFRPPAWNKGDTRPAVVFFHGGGWRNGAPPAMYWQAIYLASRGMVAISAEYRTREAYDTPASACVEDAIAAIHHVRTNARTLGVDPDRIAAGGGSAGGHLALCTAMVRPTTEEPFTPPGALILFNPVTNTVGEGFTKARMGADPRSLSPLHLVTADLPPSIVFQGDADQTTPIDGARKFVERLTELGNRAHLVVYPGQRHSFFHKNREDGRNYVDTMRRADEFLRSLGYLEGMPTIGG